MQNFGPVHIEKNIEHAAIVDASTNITLAPSQTIVEVSAQNNAAPVSHPEQPKRPEAPQEASYKPFRFNPAIDKIELLRVINAMYEYGFFYKMDIDKKADKKDVFAAFAAMLHDPRIAKYSTDLNRAKDPYSAPEVNTRIFDALRDTSKEYFDK